MKEKTLKAYEISYLLRGEEGREVLLGHLKRFRAEVLFESEAKNIKLTYPIGHLTAASFGYIQFELDPGAISNLNNILKLDKQIIRFLIITPPFIKEQKAAVEAGARTERKIAKPAVEPVEERAVSNDLLEEKLEEILNK